MTKLNKKQENKITMRALETAAAQVKSKGVADVPEGSYPFSIETEIIGELVVEKGTKVGKPTTVCDFGPNDVLRGILATAENPSKLVSDALGWHKSSDKDTRKSQDEKSTKTMLSCAKRRKMTSESTTKAKAGATRAKPSVALSGTVGSRQISLEVEAA